MLGLLTLSKCLRFGAMAMVLVALLSITPCSARPAIEADDSIPIQTLKAVNDLVQSIAGNLQQAGSGSYFRARSGSNVRNINVNVDGEEEEAVAELAKAKKNEIKN
ncbi:hypothetical protein ZHAS_00016674 [Anopheles sinensis]|uniref:Uncharacterized protein n=1 Tax=Anopheles sinensis TaxID=74873 RepID=A0A084WEN3_ANOSI|nr:hypothetical protein ZHAS_00016674 [Anopheles sinensis]